MSLDYPFGYSWDKSKPPAFHERRARFDQLCEKGCGGVIAKGEIYRRTRSMDQVICMDCWDRCWPGDAK